MVGEDGGEDEWMKGLGREGCGRRKVSVAERANDLLVCHGPRQVCAIMADEVCKQTLGYRSTEDRAAHQQHVFASSENNPQ